MNDQQSPWEVLSRFVEIKSPWLTVIGERLRDDANKELEYWRVEKANSLVVVTVQDNKFVLPKPMYRPGVSRTTLDFCGGRMDDSMPQAEIAERIVKREFSLESTDSIFANLKPINLTPWDVNSSFENQQLYGFFAEISNEVHIDPAHIGASFEVSPSGIQQFLNEIVCLQCRALVLDWLNTNPVK